MATVGTGVGFSPDITQPLDNRTVVANQATRLALPTGRIYEGLLVFQEDTNELFVLIDSSDASISTNWEIANSHISGSNFTITGSIQQTGSDSYFISKVGIGTMLPTAQLHVSGTNNQTVHIESPTQDAKVGIRLDSLRANSNGNTMGGSYLYKQDSLTYFDTDESFIIRPNGRRALQIDGNGDIQFISSSTNEATTTTYFFGDPVTKRIGIGTTSPLYSLHNTGTSRLEGRVILGHNVNNFIEGVSDGVKFKTDNHYTFDKGANTLVKILNDGNVGIGTTSPDYKLDVSGSARLGGSQATTTLYIESTGSFGLPVTASQIEMKGYESRGIGTFYKDLDATNKEWFAGVPYQNNTLTRYQIGYSDNVDGRAEYQASASLTIRASGDVGIGTTPDPTSRLHIKSPTTTALTIEGATNNSKNIFFSGDNNVNEAKIREHAGTLGFYTGGDLVDANASMFITSESKNVGIGITTPGEKLHIFGTSRIVKIEGNGVTSAYLNFKTNESERWNIGVPSGQTRLNFNNGSSDLATILTDGNVGIGTTSPAATLHVIGSPGSTATIESSTQSTLNLKTTTGGNKNNYIVGMTTGDLSFRPNATTSTTLKADGKVGIGTTTPQSQLHISSSANTTLTIESNSDNAYLKLDSGTDGVGGEESGILLYDNGAAKWEVFKTTSNNFAIHDYTRGNSVFKISDGGDMGLMHNGGNVGIGTSIPDKRLDLTVETSDDGMVLQTSSGRKALELLVDNGDNGQGYINFYTGVNLLYGKIQANSEGLILDTVANRHTIFNKAGIETMRIDTSGNVGIGETSVDARLHVTSLTSTGISNVKLESAGASKCGKCEVCNKELRIFVLGYSRSNFYRRKYSK